MFSSVEQQIEHHFFESNISSVIKYLSNETKIVVLGLIFRFRTIFDDFGRKSVNKTSLIAKKVKTMPSNRMKVQKEKDQSNNFKSISGM